MAAPRPWASTVGAHAPVLLLFATALVLRLLTMPVYIEDRDGRWFVGGVIHYSIALGRPHWPGYPVYIWAGKAAHLFISDPVRALHTLSALSSSLCLFPISWVAARARGWLGGDREGSSLAGLVAASLHAFSPLAWIDGTEIFSDPFAMLLATTLLWLCARLLDAPPERRTRLLFWASLCAGGMVGARLSYWPMTLVLLCPLAMNRKELHKGIHKGLPAAARQALFAFGIFFATVLVWLGWQWLADGRLFYSGGVEHIEGHYRGWGGSVLTDPDIAGRPLRFARVFWLYGLGGYVPGAPPVRLAATALWSVLVCSGLVRIRRGTDRRIAWLLIAFAAPYTLWIFGSHDVDLARYGHPILAVVCILAGLSPGGGPVSRASPFVAVLVLSLVTVPLALEHRTSLPLEVRLVDRLATLPAEKTIVLDGAALLFEGLLPGRQFARPDSPDPSNQAASLVAAGRDVYLGTSDPGALVSGDWEPVARFCRNRYLRSRGSNERFLFRYRPGFGPLTLPPCAP